MENLDIRTAESEILHHINSLPVCIEIKRLIVSDIHSRLKEEADKALDKEYFILKQKEQEGKDVSAEDVQQN